MIRKVEMRDLDACVELASEFFDPFLTAHGVPIIKEDLVKTVTYFIAIGQGIVVEHDGEVQGVAGWQIVNHPANAKIRIFYETLWCVKSKYKTDALLLLRALEREASNANVDLMLMANLHEEHEERLKCIFKNRGFEFIQTHYGKLLKGGKKCEGYGQSNHLSR